MKRAAFDNPNKMHFESTFKTFNKQTNYIGTGNVYANTQTSSYIRAWNDTNNYGYIGKPGEFLKFDLKPFGNIPEKIRTILFDKERSESYILYNFHIWNNGHKENVCWILTDYNHNYISGCISCGYGQSYWKRESVFQECKEYVCA